MSRPSKWLISALGASLILLLAVSAELAHLVEWRIANGPVECRVADVSGSKTHLEETLLRRFGDWWLKSARVCSVGGFTVIVPSGQVSGERLRVYRGHKPVLIESLGSTWVYAPTVPDRRIDRMVVNLWHPCGGPVTRLLYNVWRRSSHVTVEDSSFEGQPDTRVIWKGHDVQQVYGWFGDQWGPIHDRQILVAGTWKPVYFDDGRWRLGRPPASPSKSSVDADCASR